MKHYHPNYYLFLYSIPTKTYRIQLINSSLFNLTLDIIFGNEGQEVLHRDLKH